MRIFLGVFLISASTSSTFILFPEDGVREKDGNRMFFSSQLISAVYRPGFTIAKRNIRRIAIFV